MRVFMSSLLFFVVTHTEVRIALVGKYTGLHDTYLSVVKALLHASLACNQKLHIEWIDSTALTTVATSGQGSGLEAYSKAWQQVCVRDARLHVSLVVQRDV